MENRTNLLLANALRFGLALAAVNFIIFLIFYILDFNLSSFTYSIVGFFLDITTYFGIFIYSNNILKKVYFGGNLSYGQGFLNSFIGGLVATITFKFLSSLFYTFYDPESFTQMISNIIIKMQESGWLTSKELDELIDSYNKLTPFSFAAQQIWMNLIGCLIVALIVSAITKTKSNPFADQPEDTNTTI